VVGGKGPDSYCRACAGKFFRVFVFADHTGALPASRPGTDGPEWCAGGQIGARGSRWGPKLSPNRDKIITLSLRTSRGKPYKISQKSKKKEPLGAIMGPDGNGSPQKKLMGRAPSTLSARPEDRRGEFYTPGGARAAGHRAGFEGQPMAGNSLCNG